MELINLKQKETFDRFIEKEGSELLQSWGWGEFQSGAGAEIIRLGIENGGELRAIATLIENKIFFGKYFYCPRGPVFASGSGEREREDFFASLAAWAMKENAVFIRFDLLPAKDELKFPNPPYQEGFLSGPSDKTNLAEGLSKRGDLGGLNFIKTRDIQPSKTLVLDLSLSEEDLLKRMRQKTRYNIRLAEKKGVKVREARPEEFEEFWRLIKETGERDTFRLHGREYYRKMISFDGSLIKFFFAEFENKVLAAGIFSFFGSEVRYLHGASSNDSRNLMAPFLLHWELIKKAKKENYSRYDFYGVDEKKWPGVTRFKRGFGGEPVEYPGTFDLIVRPAAYRIYQVSRQFKKMIR